MKLGKRVKDLRPAIVPVNERYERRHRECYRVTVDASSTNIAILLTYKGANGQDLPYHFVARTRSILPVLMQVVPKKHIRRLAEKILL